MGAKFRISKNSIKVFKGSKLKSSSLSTSPYPGFPTDLQAQLMSLMCISDGKSKIKETIFENRFMHVPELMRMGAKISIKKKSNSIKKTRKKNVEDIYAQYLNQYYNYTIKDKNINIIKRKLYSNFDNSKVCF